MLWDPQRSNPDRINARGSDLETAGSGLASRVRRPQVVSTRGEAVGGPVGAQSRDVTELFESPEGAQST